MYIMVALSPVMSLIDIYGGCRGERLFAPRASFAMKGSAANSIPGHNVTADKQVPPSPIIDSGEIIVA